MRVYLFISKQGDAIPIAQRIAEEGHRVLFYINDPKARRAGDGLVDKHKESGVAISEGGRINNTVVSSLLSPTPDCIVFDMVGSGFGKLADKLAKKFPVVGGNAWGDHIELDRAFGAKVMHTMKINYPETFVFSGGDTYKRAIDFVKGRREAYVYKPSGNQPTTTTYVGEGPDDTIGMLEFYSKEIMADFELQTKKSGIEISMELWFNGKDVVNVNYTMEEKTLMEGGKGPKAGCMGSVVWMGSQKDKLFREGIGRLVPLLRKVKYRGPIDLNTIVDEKQLWGLEFTARFGYDAIFILLEMYKGKINDLLYGIASGVQREMKFKSNLGLGMSMGIPPFPLVGVEPDLYKDVPIQGFNAHNLKHIWIYDVYKKKEKYLASGNGGNIGTVTARGDDIAGWSPIRDAKRRVLRTINRLVIPDLMYRRDIGDRVEGERTTLRKWGWI